MKSGKKYIECFAFKLGSKNLIVLKGIKGYVMCGYLNLKAAEKFGDLAVKIVGVATIDQAVKSCVHSATSAAKKAGIYKGQPVREVLKIIA